MMSSKSMSRVSRDVKKSTIFGEVRHNTENIVKKKTISIQRAF